MIDTKYEARLVDIVRKLSPEVCVSVERDLTRILQENPAFERRLEALTTELCYCRSTVGRLGLPYHDLRGLDVARIRVYAYGLLLGEEE